ncbi:MAG: XRE family transcriptional regulator [Bacteroidales bacterium]|nr:XRE family transcriptional regulator [Bacteroidales bacterium]
MVHIGQEIKKELIRQERTPTWLAKKISCQSQNVHNIFKRKSIDTEQLLRISNALQYDFFKLYQNEEDF